MRRIIFTICSLMFILCSCQTKHVAAYMWKRVTPNESNIKGYRTIEAEGQTRSIIPVKEITFASDSDSYHLMHHHGAAIESDIMAYRIYFDQKQTIDVYAKKTPQMELDKCYWYPNDQQLADGYGDDVLRVSGMIGVGSVKPYNGKKMVHYDTVMYRSQRIVKNSHHKAAIEMTQMGWLWHGKRLNITTRYTMKAGDRSMLCEVWVNDSIKDLCTGVQKVGEKLFLTNYITKQFHGDYYYDGYDYSPRFNQGIMLASWGNDWPVNDTTKYAKETVGLAVYVPFPYAGKKVSDSKNNLVLLDLQKSANGKYYAKFYLTVVAQKETNSPAQSSLEFKQFLNEWIGDIISNN